MAAAVTEDFRILVERRFAQRRSAASTALPERRKTPVADRRYSRCDGQEEGPPAQKQKMLKMNERTHYVL